MKALDVLAEALADEWERLGTGAYSMTFEIAGTKVRVTVRQEPVLHQFETLAGVYDGNYTMTEEGKG